MSYAIAINLAGARSDEGAFAPQRDARSRGTRILDRGEISHYYLTSVQCPTVGLYTIFGTKILTRVSTVLNKSREARCAAGPKGGGWAWPTYTQGARSAPRAPHGRVTLTADRRPP